MIPTKILKEVSDSVTTVLILCNGGYTWYVRYLVVS
jgi:hypothetical protein